MGLQACRYALRVAGSNGAQRSLVGRHLAAVAIALVLLVLGQRVWLHNRWFRRKRGGRRAILITDRLRRLSSLLTGSRNRTRSSVMHSLMGRRIRNRGSRLTRNSHIRHSRSRIRSNIRSRVMVRPNRAAAAECGAAGAIGRADCAVSGHPGGANAGCVDLSGAGCGRRPLDTDAGKCVSVRRLRVGPTCRTGTRA